MRALIATLTALMLFAAMPVVARDWKGKNGLAAYRTGDYQKAFRLFKPFAEQGHAPVQNMLELMYKIGLGVPEDDAKAVYWYTKAAKQGNAGAQFFVGL